MEKKEDTHYLKPIITEERIWNLHNLFISFIIGTFLIAIFIITINYLSLTLTQVLIIAMIIIVAYSIVLFFLLEPKKLRKVKQVVVKKSNAKSKPIIKTVYKQIPYETEKRIYVTNPPEKKPKKKYNFCSSIKSKTYHNASCRLSKLIKEEYKIGRNDEEYFKNHKFKPCKVCIQNKYPQLK